MACGCAERRVMLGRALQAVRAGDGQAVKRELASAAQSAAVDLAKVRAAAVTAARARLAGGRRG